MEIENVYSHSGVVSYNINVSHQVEGIEKAEGFLRTQLVFERTQAGAGRFLGDGSKGGGRGQEGGKDHRLHGS